MEMQEHSQKVREEVVKKRKTFQASNNFQFISWMNWKWIFICKKYKLKVLCHLHSPSLHNFWLYHNKSIVALMWQTVESIKG